MLRLVLATPRPAALSAFRAALAADPAVTLQLVASGAEALDAVRAAPPHLVILDAALPDAEPLACVRELLTVNALVNTAVLSPLTEAEFHEASEGLGVLARLPLEPDATAAADLLDKLRQVLGPAG